jgi:transcriptional regulator with GAF, ATPase, and Fis domain
MVKVPWQQLMRLHVVKSTAKLLERRWGLALGHVDTRGTEAVAPHGRGFGDGLICDLVQKTHAGTIECGRSARLLADDLKGECGSNCHVGLRQMLAPITVGRTVGAFIVGGFLQEDDDLEVVGSRLKKIDARGADLLPARRLGAKDIAFVQELLRNAADEAATFLSQRGARADDTRTAYGAIMGTSPPMQELYSLLDRVVKSDTTVLIQGENGTGKELVAKAIHRNSRRGDQRFVVQNCSAFNDNLLDSELFGHRRGAFTGAVSDKEGLFQVADKGTFFLDEIGDMSPALQVKVLRVLQEGTFTPVGDTRERHVNVRILAATNRDLRAMVADGSFREDLYYRINVINLVLPPLRSRRDDIPGLVNHFLAKQAEQGGREKRMSEACLDKLVHYDWPGNVRERAGCGALRGRRDPDRGDVV